MADPFRSARLVYRAIDIPDDEGIFRAIKHDTIAFRQADHRLSKPHNRQWISEDMMKYTENALMAVIPCIPCEEAPSAGVALARTADASAATPASALIPIGLIRLKRAKMDQHRRSEIGLSVAAPYRNQGYGTEAIVWILEWGFKTAGLHRIGIKTVEFNEGARRLYERLGFVYEGVTRECIFQDGKWWDEYNFSLLEHEWKEMKSFSGIKAAESEG